MESLLKSLSDPVLAEEQIGILTKALEEHPMDDYDKGKIYTDLVRYQLVSGNFSQAYQFAEQAESLGWGSVAWHRYYLGANDANRNMDILKSIARIERLDPVFSYLLSAEYYLSISDHNEARRFVEKASNAENIGLNAHRLSELRKKIEEN